MNVLEDLWDKLGGGCKPRSEDCVVDFPEPVLRLAVPLPLAGALHVGHFGAGAGYPSGFSQPSLWRTQQANASALGDFWGLEGTSSELCHHRLGEPGGEEGSTSQDPLGHEDEVSVDYPRGLGLSPILNVKWQPGSRVESTELEMRDNL